MKIFEALQSILSLTSMIAIGYWMSRKNWFNKESSLVLVKLVINITLPFMVLDNIIGYFNLADIASYGKGLSLLILAFFVNIFLAIFIARLTRIPKNQIGVFSSMCFLSNSMFIGLPVNIALFGERSIPYVLLYFVVNTTTFWTVGVYLIQRDRKENTTFDFKNFKRILTPPLISLLISCIIVSFSIQLPKFLLDTAKMVGGMTTPIVLFYIGIVFYHLLQKKIIINRQILLALIGRFFLAPAIIVLFFLHTDLPVLMKKVFIMQSAMPVMTQIVIVTKNYNADEELATLGTFISTTIGFILIPIYMIILNLFN